MCGMMGALWFARWARHSHIYFARLIPASCKNGYVALVGVIFLLVVIVLSLSVGV